VPSRPNGPSYLLEAKYCGQGTDNLKHLEDCHKQGTRFKRGAMYQPEAYGIALLS